MGREIVLLALIMLLFFFSPAAADFKTIDPGADIFIGEQGINISAGIGTAPSIAWFAAGSSPVTDIPNYVKSVSNPANFYVAPADFVGRTGYWYQWTGASPAGVPAIHVMDPSLDLKVWDQNTNKDVSGKQVPPTEYINFRIETNMYTIAARDPSAQGIFTIKVRDPNGAVYTTLFQTSQAVSNPDGIRIPLTKVLVNQQPGYWVAPIAAGTGWFTGALDLQEARMYKTGTYTCTVETNINSMEDNYRAPDGSAYTGKTISAARPVTLTYEVVPPASITSLRNITYQTDFITWAWSDPTSPEFDKVMVFLDGAFKANVTKGLQSYTALSLNPDTQYTLSTRTVAISGLINQSWVNSTARTAVLVKPFPGESVSPKDTDHSGLYPDINGNGRRDFNDVALFFRHIEWVKTNEPISCFDFNRNGRIDFNDVIVLFAAM